MKSEEGVEKVRKQLADVAAELDTLEKVSAEGRFPGASLWLRELNMLESIVREGLETNWLYGESKKYKFS